MKKNVVITIQVGFDGDKTFVDAKMNEEYSDIELARISSATAYLYGQRYGNLIRQKIGNLGEVKDGKEERVKQLIGKLCNEMCRIATDGYVSETNKIVF